MHSQVQIAVAINNFEMARQTIAKKRKLREAAALLNRNHIGVHEMHEIEERLNYIADAHLEVALTTLKDPIAYPTTRAKIEHLAKALALRPFHF